MECLKYKYLPLKAKYAFRYGRCRIRLMNPTTYIACENMKSTLERILNTKLLSKNKISNSRRYSLNYETFQATLKYEVI